MIAGDSVFALRSAGVRLGQRLVLDDISFQVPAGSVCVIVGPNGAGKTTLLRLIAGAVTPSSGSVSRPERNGRPRLALVAQAIALYPFMTLRENCLASGRMEGLRGKALVAETDAAIAQTLCFDVQSQLAGRLSGGYQRRAAIAAALMVDAPLLLLDEPTTGLDAEATRAVVTLIRRISEAGKTVVLATHDFAVADAVATIVLLLSNGRLVAADHPKRLCDDRFRGKKHVSLILAEETTPLQREALRAVMARQISPLHYSLLCDENANGEPQPVRCLREKGLAIIEVRVREPGIATLFERLCLNGTAP